MEENVCWMKEADFGRYLCKEDGQARIARVAPVR